MGSTILLNTNLFYNISLIEPLTIQIRKINLNQLIINTYIVNNSASIYSGSEFFHNIPNTCKTPPNRGIYCVILNHL